MERLSENRAQGYISVPLSPALNVREDTGRPPDYKAVWRGHAVAGSSVVSAPDSDQYVIVADMLDVFVWNRWSEEMRENLSSYFWEVAVDLKEHNRSTSLGHYYRPVGFKQDTMLLGVYNATKNWANWMAVSFSEHMPGDGYSIRSTAYFGDVGTKPLVKSGWEPGVQFYDSGHYRVVVEYADCDMEFGLGFAFYFNRY